MKTIIKSQEQLDSLIKNDSCIANVYYDLNFNYIPIDWKKEYIIMVNINNRTELERIERYSLIKTLLIKIKQLLK